MKNVLAVVFVFVILALVVYAATLVTSAITASLARIDSISSSEGSTVVPLNYVVGVVQKDDAGQLILSVASGEDLTPPYLIAVRNIDRDDVKKLLGKRVIAKGLTGVYGTETVTGHYVFVLCEIEEWKE